MRLGRTRRRIVVSLVCFVCGSWLNDNEGLGLGGCDETFGCDGFGSYSYIDTLLKI
jgi:hypothetical protein